MGIKKEDEFDKDVDDTLNTIYEDVNDAHSKEEWSSSSSVKDLLGLAPLLVTIERQIVSILLAKGLVKVHAESDSVNDYTFDNVELTVKGNALVLDTLEAKEVDTLISTLTQINSKVMLNSSIKVIVTDDQVESYRQLFPIGSRGPGSKIVKHRLEKFLLEHECTYQELCEAAKYYIKHNLSKGYNVMGSHFFLYKRDQQSKVDESKAEEFLEQYRQAKVSNDWRDQVV